MTITYLVTVCNELLEIQRLLSLLREFKDEEDEIVVIYDSKNGLQEVAMYLRAQTVNKAFAWHSFDFDSNFAELKNFGTRLCGKDFICQVDADEMMHPYFFTGIKTLLNQDNIPDVILLPRINTVEGITDEHIKKWNWRKSSNGWINYPDYQFRVYRNNGKIRWTGKVHETLEGYESYSAIPEDYFKLALIHHKSIKRQEKQNSYYETL